MPLQAALKKLPKKPDALVSNHPLDDMVLNEFLTGPKRSEIFDDAESMESAHAVKKAWDQLTRKDSSATDFHRIVVDQWKDAISTLQPRTLAISQYESGFFQRNGIFAPDRAAFEVLKELKQAFGQTDPFIKKRLSRQRLQADRWLVVQFRSPNDSKPDALKRLGSDLFVQNWADPVALGPNTILYKSDETPIRPIRIGKNPHQGSIPVWVDRQTDPLRIAMEGNAGSGRAAYVGQNKNLKGIGQTSLATSKNPNHSNGGLDLANATWEMLGSNMVATNLVTGGSRVTGMYLRGDLVSVSWTDKKLKAAVIERVDDGGTLDRVTHLFERNSPLSKQKILRMASQFGRQDAEKFMERIVHGAWSAGNISPEGHMIDFDTVSSVRGRSPQYTLTGKWLGNIFGLESVGQLILLKSVVEHSINADKVTYREVQNSFYKARTELMNNRFADFMGIQSHHTEGFNYANRHQLQGLVRRFEKLSRLMYPNFSAMAKWLPEADQNAVFDFSKFMRFYPLWKIHGLTGPQMLAEMINPKNFEQRLSEYVADDVVKALDNQGLVIRDQKAFDNAQNEVLQFIQDYDAILSPRLKDPHQIFGIIANAYRVNEDRLYLSYGPGYRTIRNIVEDLSTGKLTTARFQRLMEVLQIANDRLPIDPTEPLVDVNVRVYKEGWIAQRLFQDGTYQFVANRFVDKSSRQKQSEVAFYSARKNLRTINLDLNPPVFEDSTGVPFIWTSF